MRAVNATLDSKNIPGMISTTGNNTSKGMPLGKVLFLHEQRLKLLEQETDTKTTQTVEMLAKTLTSLGAKISVLEEKFTTLDKTLSSLQTAENEENEENGENEENETN